MGQVGSSTLYYNLFGKKATRILMVGLYGAGKSTILYTLGIGRVVSTIPTTPLQCLVETMQFENVTFTAFDVDGQDELTPFWRNYYTNTQAIIFVVDSNDKERLIEARKELELMTQEDELRDAILLVFANKQDLPSACSVADVTDALGLQGMKNRKWHTQATCAMSSDGLYEGMYWLSTEICKI